MSTAYEIPLSAEPQTFVITLAGAARRLTVRWSDLTGLWLLDLASPEGDPILSGLPLLPGVDLLGQHKHLGFGGELWVQSLSDPNKTPDLESLGTDGLVFFVVP